MNREDSGLIDLFAIHNRASASPAPDQVPADVLSTPPPAFTADISAGADLDDELANPFAPKPRKKLMMIAGAGAMLLLLGIVVASLGGASAEPAKAAASAIEAPPPPAAPIPPAAATTAPAAAEPPAPPAVTAAPAPPSTGASAVAKPHLRRGKGHPAGSKRRGGRGGGVKLTKVKSAGVDGH